jgi:transposase-like protein
MSNYNEETKGAVMAALLAGQSVSSVAKEYNIPKGTVSGWRKQAREFVAGGRAGSDPKKGERVGDLLIEYLEANLITLKQQVEAFGDPVWLKKQTASDAAVLHGVMTDKAVRLLEAFGDNSDTDATN